MFIFFLHCKLPYLWTVPKLHLLSIKPWWNNFYWLQSCAPLDKKYLSTRITFKFFIHHKSNNCSSDVLLPNVKGEQNYVLRKLWWGTVAELQETFFLTYETTNPKTNFAVKCLFRNCLENIRYCRKTIIMNVHTGRILRSVQKQYSLVTANYVGRLLN